MSVRHCFAIFVATLLISSGCDDHTVVKVRTSQDTAGSSDSSEGDAGASDAAPNIAVPVPESFAGDFNPDGKTVGTEVGNLAPEINGKDMDGVAFKLSDYRGKVVMLDFWGDW